MKDFRLFFVVVNNFPLSVSQSLSECLGHKDIFVKTVALKIVKKEI